VAPSDTEIAWLAGLLEGEGYFGMVNNRVNGKTYRYPLGARRKAMIDAALAEYGAIESTAVRRRRACSEATKRGWASGRYDNRAKAT
jgi:hypothetical protein